MTFPLSRASSGELELKTFFDLGSIVRLHCQPLLAWHSGTPNLRKAGERRREGVRILNPEIRITPQAGVELDALAHRLNENAASTG